MQKELELLIVLALMIVSISKRNASRPCLQSSISPLFYMHLEEKKSLALKKNATTVKLHSLFLSNDANSLQFALGL
jgi:hypothetical protein